MLQIQKHCPAKSVAQQSPAKPQPKKGTPFKLFCPEHYVARMKTFFGNHRTDSEDLCLMGLPPLQLMAIFGTDGQDNHYNDTLARWICTMWMEYGPLPCPLQFSNGTRNVWLLETVLAPVTTDAATLVKAHLARKGHRYRDKFHYFQGPADESLQNVKQKAPLSQEAAMLGIRLTMWDMDRNQPTDASSLTQICANIPFFFLPGQSWLCVLAVKLSTCIMSAFSQRGYLYENKSKSNEDITAGEFNTFKPYRVITHDQTLADLMTAACGVSGTPLPSHGFAWTSLPFVDPLCESFVITSTETTFSAVPTPLNACRPVVPASKLCLNSYAQQVCVCSGCGHVGVDRNGGLSLFDKLLRCSLCQTTW